MNLNKNLVKLFFSTFISTILMLLSSVLLARLLTVEDRGELQLFTTIVSYIATLSFGGVGFAITLAIKNNQYVGWLKYIFISIGIASIISLVVYFIRDISFSYIILVVNIFLTGVILVSTEKSKIDNQLSFYQRISLFSSLISCLVYGGVVAFYGKLTLDSVLTIITVVLSLQFLVCLYYLFGFNKQFRMGNGRIDNVFFIKNWLKQNALQSFGATVTNVDKFFIFYFLGEYVLGLYAICIAFDSLVSKFLNMLADYYYSGVLNNINRLKEVMVVVLVGIIATIVIVPVSADFFISMVFGQKYVEISEYLIWFVINSILTGVAWILSQNMLILGKQLLLVMRQIISLLVFIVVFYLSYHEGILGLILSLLSATIVRLIISIFYFYKYPIPVVRDST